MEHYGAGTDCRRHRAEPHFRARFAGRGHPPVMLREDRRIILIDDEEAVLFGLRRVLSEPGLLVDTARTPAEAETLVGKQSYVAALIDIPLSNSTAAEELELISYLRSRQRQCRIIVLNAYGDESIVRPAIESGADLLLEKPVEPELIKKNLYVMGVY